MTVVRLMKRSMTSARASTEQAISGQIGQPAACMMENKLDLRTDETPCDYGPRGPGSNPGRASLVSAVKQPTVVVDNFVEK